MIFNIKLAILSNKLSILKYFLCEFSTYFVILAMKDKITKHLKKDYLITLEKTGKTESSFNLPINNIYQESSFSKGTT